MRSALPGSGTAFNQTQAGPAPAWSAASSSPVVMSASQPPGVARRDAALTAWGMRSTARRVTQSNCSSSDSPRAEWTLAEIPRVRTASCRKAAFLPCDSARVTAISGRQRAMGIPGNPAPEPKSSSVAIPAGRARAQAIDTLRSRRQGQSPPPPDQPRSKGH